MAECSNHKAARPQPATNHQGGGGYKQNKREKLKEKAGEWPDEGVVEQKEE